MAEVVDESLECECKAGFVQALFPDSSLECERCALWIAAAIGGYMFFCLGLLFLWTCGQLEISVVFEGTHFGERRRVAVSARKHEALTILRSDSMSCQLSSFHYSQRLP